MSHLVTPAQIFEGEGRVLRDIRTHAALIETSGRVWGGCVYDTDAIVAQLTSVDASIR
jgi:hypothetical protein